MTEAGLNTVNLSQLNTFQQVILFALIILGSAIWVSITTVHIRKRAFEQKLQELADKRTKKLRLSRSFHISLSRTRKNSSDQRETAVASGAVRGRAIIDSKGCSKDHSTPDPEEHITFDQPDQQPAPDGHVVPDDVEDSDHPASRSEALPISLHNKLDSDQSFTTGRGNDGHDSRPLGAHPLAMPAKLEILEFPHPKSRPSDGNSATMLRRSQTRIFSGRGVGARGLNNHPRNATPHAHQTSSIDDEEKALKRSHDSFTVLSKYLQGFNGLVGRNSQFHGLSEKERRALGGLEYDALCLLSYLVPAYFLLFQLAGAVALGAWMQINRPGLALENGLSPFWTGSFFAVVSGSLNLITANSDPLRRVLSTTLAW